MSFTHNNESSRNQTHNVGMTSAAVVFQIQLQPTAGRQVHDVGHIMHQQKQINVALQLSALENYNRHHSLLENLSIGNNAGTVIQQLRLNFVFF